MIDPSLGQAIDALTRIPPAFEINHETVLRDLIVALPPMRRMTRRQRWVDKLRRAWRELCE